MKAIVELKALGYEVAVEGDQIRLRHHGTQEPDPAQVAPLIESVKEHKDDAIRFLRGNLEREGTGRRECYFCGGTRFWISVYGMTICTRCHPPAAPHLVADWLGEDPEHAGRPPEVVH